MFRYGWTENTDARMVRALGASGEEMGCACSVHNERLRLSAHIVVSSLALRVFYSIRPRTYITYDHTRVMPVEVVSSNC